MAKVTVTDLLGAAGDQTYAQAAGITLADEPAPMFALLVLTVLLSHRIDSDLAVDAARELFADGATTAPALIEPTWHQRVDALGRAVELGLPHTPGGLANNTGSNDLAAVAAAPIRYATDRSVRERMT